MTGEECSSHYSSVMRVTTLKNEKNAAYSGVGPPNKKKKHNKTEYKIFQSTFLCDVVSGV